MPNITPTRVSRFRLALGRTDLALVAVIAAALAASILVVAIGPVDALAAAAGTMRCS